ncbi:MAG: RNA 2',3'-cyclic phosphodiesterase [Planctomycetota bacterium]|jgi:2'-5' RNA ligase
MRAFLAIPLPADVRAALAAAGQKIPGLRAQRPDTLHLTLRFLDEIADPAPIVAAVAPVARAHEPFDMSLERIGVFPHDRAPRVVWVGLGEGEMQAGALAAGVESALLPLGFRRERRPWRGHITLGRFREPHAAPRNVADPERRFGRVRAGVLALYRSILTPDGAVHEALEEMSLGRAK